MNLAEEYIGKKITEFHADSDVIGDILERLKCNQTIKEYPATLRCKDGSVKHVLITSNVYWKDGKFVHTRCFTRDVTASYHQSQWLEVILNRCTIHQINLELNQAKLPSHTGKSWSWAALQNIVN